MCRPFGILRDLQESNWNQTMHRKLLNVSRPTTRLLVAASLGSILAILFTTSALAYWNSWTGSQVISNFALSGGSDLDGWVYWRFETGSLNAQVYGLNQASAAIPEIYVYTSAQDKCAPTSAWSLFAYEDDLQYNAQVASTDHLTTPPTGTSVGQYQNCSSYHAYRWYVETWGVDPAPNWQWTSSSVIN